MMKSSETIRKRNPQMNAWRAVAIALCVLFVSLMQFPSSANAQANEKLYAFLGAWSILSDTANGRFNGCFARTRSPHAQAGYGSELRIGHSTNGSQEFWLIATDFDLNAPSQQSTILIDGHSYPATFFMMDKWAGAQLHPAMQLTLRFAKSSINLNLEPGGPFFKVNNMTTIMDRLNECFKKRGRH